MTDKLLPCPFCWSTASLEAGLTANVGGEEIQYVTCTSCSAQADPHDWQTRPDGPSPQDHTAALEEIKYLALTAGAPGHTPVPKALARILFLCNRAGVTKKLDELRPLFATTEGSRS